MGKQRKDNVKEVYIPAVDAIDLCDIRDLARSVCNEKESPRERKGCRAGVDAFLEATIAQVEEKALPKTADKTEEKPFKKLDWEEDE